MPSQDDGEPKRHGGAAATQPSVGIFWGVTDGSGLVLVTDLTPLSEAEPYGEALTHPRGHYEVWEAWQALGPAGLRRRGLPTVIASHEYEHFPRGRVVFMVPSDRFTLYADRRLQQPEQIAQIIRRFGLTERKHVVRSDAHYRSWI